MFTDKIEIEIKAGRGGDGRLSFRHEKYRAKGGPDGGDGGRGGNVIFRVDHNLHTLSAFRKQRTIQAKSGKPGGGDRKHGKAGEDVIIKVPPGTQVYENGIMVEDLTQDSEEIIIAKGGRGGFGNAHFTSSTRQAPRATELGEAGEYKKLVLELKLVADVGLVGLPNAGKSTLLSVISNAKPEIADYPFTTITPNLGVVDFEDLTFLVADIPGLIEGASEGKGLGDDFLRHIERTAVILHLIDAYSTEVTADYQTIQNELKHYSVDLTKKPQLVVLTKVEGMPPNDLAKQKRALKKAFGRSVYAISSAAHLGIPELFRAMKPLVVQARTKRLEEEAVTAIHIYDEASQPDLWKIQRDGAVYIITGENIEGFARRTDWDNDSSVDRLRDILHKRGVDRELAKQGAEPGSLIRIGDYELDWLGQ